jgi:hypothetical protein
LEEVNYGGGIFTPASDVFSLGKTLLWLFDWDLKRFKYAEPELLHLRSIWQKMAESMTDTNPQMRPSLLTCIHIALFAFNSFHRPKLNLMVKEAETILQEAGRAVSGISSFEECWAALLGSDKAALSIPTLPISTNPQDSDNNVK